MRKKSLYFCVVLLYILGVCDSRRSGGGSRHSSSSYSRPSPSRPSYHSPSRPSYSSPSHPSPSRPSYSFPSHPSPSLPSYSSPSRPSYPSFSSPSRPSYSSPSYSSPSRPSYSPPSRPSHPYPSLPSPARPSAKPAGPNVGWHPAGPSVSKPGLRPSYPSYPSPSSNAKPAPKGPPLNSKPLHNSGKTHGSILTSQKKPTLGSAPQGPPKPSYTQGTFQGPPSYPPAYPGHGYPPPAYPGHGYPPPAYPGHYPPSHNAGSNVIINNNNIVHSPSPSWSYGYPSYHYHNSDTGSTSLGFYLGYTLGRVRNPTYYYFHNSYDGYRPRYDHYTVHHYYHNNNERIIERERIIEPNTVVGCVGDSGSICPANTRSLCTEQGVIMCVASISATVPCKDEKDTNCVTSTIPCVNSKDPRCKNNPQNATTVSIPCISTAKINGTVTYVNNTIIVENFNSSRPSRSVVDNATEYPTTTDAIPITTTTNTTPTTTIDLMTTYPSPTTNITQSTTPTTTIPNSTTSVPITSSTTTQLTTTPLPKVKSKMTKNKHVKPQEPQNYCVTIMAVPNERKPTKGEELFDQVENFVEDFLVKSFGL
ncbi:unnamed protein product [Brassicogethes aeneus]|uniref:Uncharacterized protein n=1 Tax=Brassicogethes aeneus TaxID=1431903 RepID=A0A9P0B494_BRAAE|nr:unnamed protein product [Brassicogethes aeneus]